MSLGVAYASTSGMDEDVIQEGKLRTNSRASVETSSFAVSYCASIAAWNADFSSAALRANPELVLQDQLRLVRPRGEVRPSTRSAKK